MKEQTDTCINKRKPKNRQPGCCLIYPLSLTHSPSRGGETNTEVPQRTEEKQKSYSCFTVAGAARSTKISYMRASYFPPPILRLPSCDPTGLGLCVGGLTPLGVFFDGFGISVGIMLLIAEHIREILLD